MREYNRKAIQDGSDFEDFIINVKLEGSTNEIREIYYYHSDDSCYWTMEKEDGIYYSDDDVFNTEKEDATHIVIFMK